MIGEKIQNYEIISRIGEGGMGNVYQAINSTENSLVVIKAILPQFVNNEEARARFNQEAVILSKFNHPNIVRLIDHYEDERGVFLILEYVDGISLDKLLPIVSEKRIQIGVKIIKQLLDGLCYAHKNNAIHRDVKPENILVDSDFNVKIIDFGISKLMDSDENLVKTVMNRNIGSPKYMSPEQHRGEIVNHKTDIYSAGIVLYEILIGKQPYEHVTSMLTLANEIVGTQLVRPSYLNTNIPKGLDFIVLRAIEKNPDDRYDDCQEFRDILTNDTVRTPEGLTLTISVIGSDKSSISFGEVATIGSKAILPFIPFLPYKILIQAPGKKQIKKTRIFDEKDNGKTIEFILEDEEKNKGKFIWILFIAIILISLIGIWRLNNNYQNSPGALKAGLEDTTNLVKNPPIELPVVPEPEPEPESESEPVIPKGVQQKTSTSGKNQIKKVGPVVLNSNNELLLTKYDSLNNNEDRIIHFFNNILKKRKLIRDDASAILKYESILEDVVIMLSKSFPDKTDKPIYSICCSNKQRFYDELEESNIKISNDLINNYKKCP